MLHSLEYPSASRTITPWQRVRFSINIYWIREHNFESLFKSYLTNRITRWTDLLAWATRCLCASQLSTRRTGKRQPDPARVWGSGGSADSGAGLLQTIPRENTNHMNGCDLVTSAEPICIFEWWIADHIYYNIYKTAAAHRKYIIYKQTSSQDGWVIFNIPYLGKCKWASNWWMGPLNQAKGIKINKLYFYFTCFTSLILLIIIILLY